MIPFSLATDLGLRGRPALLRDPAFWVILVSGTLVAVAFRFLAGKQAGIFIPSNPTAWFIVVGWQPLIEELLFRGLIQGQLLGTTWGRRRFLHLSHANLVTSALFVMIHFVTHTAPWAMSVFLPSLIFGWLRERHGNIWSPLFTHATFNLAFFVSFSNLPA